MLGIVQVVRAIYRRRRPSSLQQETAWFVICCGIFMSFLVEDSWGVVSKTKNGRVLRASNVWDSLVTATIARDIGRCTAKLVLDEGSLRNQPVYTPDDSLT